MNRKALFIIIGVVVIVAVGVGIFFWLRKPATSTPTNNGLPFGKSGENAPGSSGQAPTNGNSSVSPSNSMTGPAGLRKIADGPVSGAIIFSRGTSTPAVVRYIDKATGNIYEYNAGTNATTRITNTTIPKVEEVSWGDKGNSVVVRFLKDSAIESFMGTVSTSTATTTIGNIFELQGTYLAEDITSLLFSPKKDKIFYTVASQAGVDGYVSDKKGFGSKGIWAFPTREWIPQWVTNDIVSLTTKASNNLAGNSFSLNTKTGAFSPVLSDIPGLTTLTSPDGNFILYSQFQGSIGSLLVYDVKNKTNQNALFETLPEKCVWKDSTLFFCAVPKEGLGGNLPDTWYKGLVSFNDSIWQGTPSESGDVAASVTKVIAEPQDAQIDAVYLSLSSDGKNLIFENKKDWSLWLLPVQQ